MGFVRLWFKFEVLCRDMVCKPDPVGCLVKLKAVLMHIAGSNFQDRGRTAPGTYFSGGVRVRGKMYVEAPFTSPRFKIEGRNCSVVPW